MYLRALQINPEEKILLLARKHWFVFFLETIPFLLLALAPILVYKFLALNIQFLLPLNYFYLGLAAYCGWLLFLWMLLFIRWTIYYLDIWVLTAKRLFDLNQHWLFSRDVTVMRLEQIEDIRVDVHGLFATLLGYGNIEIETAGAEKDQFLIRNVRDPYRVKDIISRAYDAAVEK